MKFVVAAYRSRAKSSPASPSAESCCAPTEHARLDRVGGARCGRGPDSRAVEGFRRQFSKIDSPFSKIQAVTESRIG